MPPILLQQVQEVQGRRQLLASTSSGLVAGLLLLGGGAGAAQAAGESSASRAITAVTRPQQLKKKWVSLELPFVPAADVAMPAGLQLTFNLTPAL
jgi:hypothetical protein